jgi:RNA polymerase sigma-70 factor (ECF subfamily)
MEADYRDIILGCRKERQEAQLAFYDLFAPALYASAFRLLNSDWEAEEVVQEVLLKVLTDTSLLNSEADAMLRILRRMAINLSIDHLRRRKVVWEEWSDNLAEQSVESIEQAMIRQEDVAQLYSAIAMMSEKDRGILMLSIVEELTTEEISQILGIRPSSVRSQLSRAKQRLIKLYRYE